MTIKDFELVEFLKPGEDYISGDELVKRAKELGANLGKEECDFFLAHQDEIPKEWQNYYIVFTDYQRDSDRSRRVGYLSGDGGRWKLDFVWLVVGFRRAGRFPRVRKSLETGIVGSVGPSALGLILEIEKNLKALKKLV